MRRDKNGRYDDNKSEMPLAVGNASWQRFQTVDQQSNSSSICQSVSISRSSAFAHSDMGDSISNASLNRLDEDDDETSSRIRESLKKELKLIQVAKKDLKTNKKAFDTSHARSSHTIVHNNGQDE